MWPQQNMSSQKTFIQILEEDYWVFHQRPICCGLTLNFLSNPGGLAGNSVLTLVSHSHLVRHSSSPSIRRGTWGNVLGPSTPLFLFYEGQRT